MVKGVNSRARLPEFDSSCVTVSRPFNLSMVICKKKKGRTDNNNTNLIELV